MSKASIIIAALALAALTLALAGCNFGPAPQNASPTGQAITLVPSDTSSPTITPSVTASVTATFIPQLETPTSTFTPGTPTDTPTFTPTPGPYEYTIKAGDTLYGILSGFGYGDFTGIIVNQVVHLNNMASADRLPAPGSTLLIPRQTATPTPVGLDLTLTAGGNVAPSISIPANAQIVQHEVVDGESIIGIAEQYSMTLEQIAQLNPDIHFFGCDFTNPSGGPNCIINLSIGQMVNVLAPTPTPTLSPTPSGNETATPTPTYIAPLAVFPPEGGVAPPQVFTLQWVSVGELQPDEVYFVEIRDTTNGASDTEATRDTFVTLPAAMIPSDGQTHTIQWSVGIAVLNPDGHSYRYVSDKTVRTFQWQSH